MNTFCFTFRGCNEYSAVRRELEKIYNVINDPNFNYCLAVNEAVCNAVRYGLAGIDDTRIVIFVYVTDYDLKTTVKAETAPFDVEAYKVQLEALAKEKGELDWADYTGDSEKSRGFWYMLMACDQVTLTEDGNSVTLASRLPFDEALMLRKIKELVPRFLIQKREGVIV